METKQRTCGLILVECEFMYMEAKKRIKHAETEVNRITNYHIKGYDAKTWEERNPDVIKKLFEVQKHLATAFYLLEEITFHE